MSTSLSSSDTSSTSSISPRGDRKMIIKQQMSHNEHNLPSLGTNQEISSSPSQFIYAPSTQQSFTTTIIDNKQYINNMNNHYPTQQQQLIQQNHGQTALYSQQNNTLDVCD